MFRQAKRRTAGRRNFDAAKGVFLAAPAVYLSRLSFYDIPPLDEVTLEEFETWAIDRLKILVEIELCLARSKPVREIEALVRPLLLKYLPLTASGTSSAADVEKERKKDHYSHYILRLVFCRTEELRKRFVRAESVLFRIRYGLLQPREQQDFISQNASRLPWEYISADEKSTLLDHLYAASSGTVRTALMAESSGDSTFSLTNEQLRQHIASRESFIRLPFEMVPLLVASRQVYVSKGQAYIPSTLQLSLLAGEFQDLLNRQLLRTFQALPRLEEDDRLLPLLNNLLHSFASVQYDAGAFGSDPLAASDINAQSVTTEQISRHYPLCASHLQKNMIANSHLRYNGRQQFVLFLKGIGMGVDEALKFWTYQFTKQKMTVEDFNKQYKYNIRHAYGLEGARTNYRPVDCASILLKPKPSKGEFHGCPYRDLPVDALITSLNDMGIEDQQSINGIVDDVNRNEYTVACTRVFELTHKTQLAKGANKAENLHITHPNLYFDRSRQLERGEKTTAVN